MAIVPYVPKQYYRIIPVNSDPASEDHKKYIPQAVNPANLCGADRKFPIKDLNIDSSEDLILVKIKKRPVIVVSHSIKEPDDAYNDDSFWCVPSYTLVDDFFKARLPPDFIEDVFALKYRAYFPLPYHPTMHDRECMLRLDRIQPVPRHLLQPTELKLSDAWQRYLYEWIKFFLTGKLDVSENKENKIAEALHSARQLLLEELVKQRSSNQDTK